MGKMRTVQLKPSSILMKIVIKPKRDSISFSKKELKNGHNKRNELIFKMLKFLRNA
jgi:hypothetical protein